MYFEIQQPGQTFQHDEKRRLVTCILSIEKIDEYISDLPNRDEFIYKRKYKEFNAGDLKRDKIEEEKERMERLRAAVNEFDHFQQMMRQKQPL